MMKSRFLAFVCVTVFLCASAHAQNRRSAVSLDGLDTNNCTVPAPCRTFAVAIAATAANGEIIVLKSGGYGPFLIDRAVSIISPQGIHTAIAPTTGAAITVQAGADDRVVVRGLYLNSQGGTNRLPVGESPAGGEHRDQWVHP